MRASLQSRQGSCRLRLATIPLALSLLGAGSGVADLPAARSQVAQAMASGQADLLRPLLPRASKVFLQLREIRQARGYFGANQVVKVFADYFARNHPAGFTLRDTGPSGDQSPILVRGELRMARGDGDRRPLLLTFVLTRGPEGWTIREVREGA